jgi:hypothetical protein
MFDICISNRFREQPFNLKGGLLLRKVRNFYLEFNIRLYDKNSESHYFLFLHQNQNIFFSNIGKQNFFLEKNHNPPFKLNGCSSKVKIYQYELLENFLSANFLAIIDVILVV